MKTTPPDQTHSLPDTSNPSESALRKTFQKLLRKRSSKASKKLEKDLQHSSSKWQSYMQSSTQNAHLATDQPRFDDILPLRQPRLSADTEEVASTLDALGWEQATVGGSVTAEYWQFVPHGDTLDLASLASQHGKDGSQTPMSGLQTPPIAFERRRISTQQLDRAVSQPSVADSQSPVDSIQPQRHSSTMSPNAYAMRCTNYEQQQAGSRGQHRSPASLPAQLQVMPRTSSDWSHHDPNSGWQHQHQKLQVPSHLRSSLFSASHRQQMSALTPRSQSQQQNMIQPAATPAATKHQAAHVDGIAAVPSMQRSGLVSQPPSATWTQNLAADGCQAVQLPINFSSLAISDSRGSAGAAQESGRLDESGAMLQPASSHCAVSSFQSAMPRPQDRQHLLYDSQPPPGRAPSTPLAGRPPSHPLGRSPSHPLGRSPSYPLARTPSTVSSGILPASQMAVVHIDPSFSSNQPQPNAHQPKAAPDAQQQNDLVQHPQNSEIMPSYERKQMPTNSSKAQTAEPWLHPSATPPPPAFHFPAEPQPGPTALPAPDIHRTEASLQDMPMPSSTSPSLRQRARRKSFTMSVATTTPQRKPGANEPVARSNTSLTDSLSFAPAGGAFLGSPAPGSLVVGSDSQSGSKGSLRAGSTAASWVHSQSAQQLTANVKSLAAQVVSARSRQAQELAILKLYAVLSQAHFVKQQAEEWQGAFLGILALGFPLLLKHTAEIVIHQDKGYSDMVRKMAAGTLKSIARWMEGQLEGASPCRALVQQVLTQLVQEANQGGSRYAGAQGPTIHENEAWDSIMPTHQSFGYSETSGMGELLDSGTLDGMLDTDVTSIPHPGRPDHRQPRWGVMDTGGVVSSSSVVDSEAWPEPLQTRHPPPLTIRPPSILETGATCMALDTQDVADYARSHTKGLRLTFWLFKTDQEEAWYAAASLVGSMACLGEAHIDAMGGMKLVKPLFLLLRRAGNDCKAAALRALQHLTTERACRAMTARQDSYLQALVRAVQQPLISLQYPATIILARLITNDPSTHYIVAEAGLLAALAKLVKQGDMPPEVREALSEALKHLTASSQKNRNTLVSLQVLPLLIVQLTTGEEGVQYNTARLLRHLALGSQPAHKLAALPAVVPLTQALQVGRPRVQFACASALAMLVEGHPEVCPQVLRHGGIAALTIMLQTAGAQGKKAAAEALQALAAEDMDMKPRIAKSGAIGPLVGMVKSGAVQQQAAAAGALQALMYCPGRLDIAAGVASEGGIPPLVHIVKTGPLPLRSAAAAALCNLALASPHNQAAMMRAGALPALTLLLEQAQPDGQYAAAAALYNLAGQDPQVRLALVSHGAVPPLVHMLQAESWYCRIVAAEVLGRVSMEWGNRQAIEQGGAVDPLINLLRLNHSPGMLDSVEGPVHHLAYERGEDVIVMKGYKFAKAKTAAAATLGCLALANPAVASYLVQAGVAEQLMVMLESSSPEVRAVACACLGDLAAAHPPLQSYLSQRLSKLVRLVAGAKTGNAVTGSCPDVAAAAAAIGLLVAQQPAARAGLLQLRGLQPLLTLLHQGTLAEQSVAANVLFDMLQGSEAGQALGGEGVVERVHALVASTDTPAAAAGGGTAALLRNTSLLTYAGFAMTAKPSVNLLILLQIPFEELAGSRGSSQPHTLVPANLLLTTVQSLAPSTGQAPLSTHHQATQSPLSSGGETDQEDALDAALGPLQPIYPTSNFPYTSRSHALQSSSSQSAASGRVGSLAARQEQYANSTASQFHQQTVQQHILDTYLG